MILFYIFVFSLKAKKAQKKQVPQRTQSVSLAADNRSFFLSRTSNQIIKHKGNSAKEFSLNLSGCVFGSRQLETLI